MARSVKAPRRRAADKQKGAYSGQHEQQQQAHADDAGSLGGWVNCECFFSLVLVALLAALPFNLQTHELINQSKDSYLNRADALFSDGAFDKAASMYERAVNTEETAEGHVYLAEALVKANRLDQAIKHYQRASELFEQPKEKATMLSYLAKLHTETGNAELALESYGNILDIYSNVDPLALANAHVTVAEAMIDTFQQRAAIQQLQKALALVPDHASAHLLLAHCLRDLGDFRRAIGRYKRLLQLQPRDFPSLFSLGMVYHEAGDAQPALAMFKRASTLNPNSSEVQLMLAALQQQPYTGNRTPQSLVANIFDLDARRRAVTALNLGLDLPSPYFEPRTEDAIYQEAAEQQSSQQALAVPEVDSEGIANAEGDAAHVPSQMDADEEIDLLSTAEPERISHFREVFGLRLQNASDLLLPVITKQLGIEPQSGYQWLDVLELGCGRSELGSSLRTMADRLLCIEPSIIAARHLQRQGQYDDIRNSDTLSTLHAVPSSSVDLVVATEMVPYFGSIAELLQQLSRVLRPDGLVVFNTDPLVGVGDTGDGKSKYHLQSSGRWAHANSYIRSAADRLKLALQESSYYASCGCQLWALKKLRESEVLPAQ